METRLHDGRGNGRAYLETFLGGMETEAAGKRGLPMNDLETFLGGMETATRSGP